MRMTFGVVLVNRCSLLPRKNSFCVLVGLEIKVGGLPPNFLILPLFSCASCCGTVDVLIA